MRVLAFLALNKICRHKQEIFLDSVLKVSLTAQCKFISQVMRFSFALNVHDHNVHYTDAGKINFIFFSKTKKQLENELKIMLR